MILLILKRVYHRNIRYYAPQTQDMKLPDVFCSIFFSPPTEIDSSLRSYIVVELFKKLTDFYRIRILIYMLLKAPYMTLK
jgi:hypothetical protein